MAVQLSTQLLISNSLSIWLETVAQSHNILDRTMRQTDLYVDHTYSGWMEGRAVGRVIRKSVREREKETSTLYLTLFIVLRTRHQPTTMANNNCYANKRVTSGEIYLDDCVLPFEIVCHPIHILISYDVVQLHGVSFQDPFVFVPAAAPPAIKYPPACLSTCVFLPSHSVEIYLTATSKLANILKAFPYEIEII